MTAKEIVDKFKSVLLSATEEPTEVVAVEEVKLEEQEVLAEEIPVAEIAPQEAPKEEMYATKEELAQALAEMKAMYDQIMEGMSTVEATDAPAELSKEKLSSQEEVAAFTHSPEEVVSSKALHLYSNSRVKTTFDLVLSKISK
jgi:esterase/lipase